MQAGSGWWFLNGVAVCSRALAAPAHLAGFNVPSTIIYMSLLCLFFTAVVLCRGAVFSSPSFLSDSLWLVLFLFVFPCHPCYFTVPLLFSHSLFTRLHVKLHLENSMMVLPCFLNIQHSNTIISFEIRLSIF